MLVKFVYPVAAHVTQLQTISRFTRHSRLEIFSFFLTFCLISHWEDFMGLHYVFSELLLFLNISEDFRAYVSLELDFLETLV